MNKISIIIPCYNDQDGLNRLLQSIRTNFIKEVLSKVEVIIVDDFSDRKIVVNDSSISAKVLRNKKNRGPGYSRKRGANEAEGEYLLFIDSDDFFTKEINEVITRTKGNDIIMFGLEDRVDGKLLNYWKPKESRDIYKNIHSWNFIAKKEIWNSVEINSDSRIFEDWHHFLKLVYQKNLSIDIAENCFAKVYNLSQDSLSRNNISERDVEIPDVLIDNEIPLNAKQYISRLLIRNYSLRGLDYKTSRLVWKKISSNIQYSQLKFWFDYILGKIPFSLKKNVKKHLLKVR